MSITKLLNRLFPAILMILLCPIAITSTHAQTTIEGKWKNDKKGTIIVIYQEGDFYFGQVVGSEKVKEDEKIKSHSQKIIILNEFQEKDDQNYCCGTLFIPKKQKHIPAVLELKDDDTLLVNISMGSISRSLEWTRLDTHKDNPAASGTR